MLYMVFVYVNMVKKKIDTMYIFCPCLPYQTPHAKMPKLSQTRVRICKKVPCQMRHYYL